MVLRPLSMTLTQTAILTKQIIVVSIITIIVSTVSFVGYKIWYAHYLASLPPVEAKPDTKFGILPYPNFPTAPVSSSNFSYTLDTSTGGLPKIGIDPGFDKLIKVYFIIKPLVTFSSADKAQALADKFGFTKPPNVLNDTTYEYKEDNKNLLVDLNSGNFAYTKEASPSSSQTLEDDDQLIGGFENALTTLGVFKDELKTGRNKISRENDSVANISLWPVDVDKKQIVTPDLNKSLISARVIGSSSTLDNYLSLDFTSYQVDKNTFATYPTKTPDEAFTDLKSGQGTVLVEPTKPDVSITSVSMAYYLPDSYAPYLQPVYLFEGPDFAALVPAVNNHFLKKESSNQ